jgi:hypothetical protein
VATLVKCMRTDLDCADMCDVTAKVLTRQTEFDLVVVRAALSACLAAIVAFAEDACRQLWPHWMTGKRWQSGRQHARRTVQVLRAADLRGPRGFGDCGRWERSRRRTP